MFKDPTFRASVIASVIASILVILFVQPILNFGWAIILWLGTHIFYGMLNDIYTNAAFGHREWVVAMFAVCTLIFLPIIILIELFVRRFRKIKIENVKDHPHHIISLLMKVSDIGGAIIIPLISIYLAASIFIDLQLNTSFDQRIAVLTPKVSDQTIKELRAQWAQMGTREDYLALSARLEQLAHDAGITLPKPLLK